MNTVSSLVIVATSLLCLPGAVHAQQSAGPVTSERVTSAQQNVPPAAQDAQRDVERTVRRFGGGVTGGVGIDPEIIHVGAHATFGPIFRQGLQLRPGVEIGVGELTTLFSVNIDVLYTFDNESRATAWLPYVGAGAAFGLSHRGFHTDDSDNIEIDGLPIDDRNRFDFSDTDFNSGMNFIAGMRKQKLFFEMRTTAWGVSTIRLLAGFNF